MSEKLLGTKPNQVPTNADLGEMAYKNVAVFTYEPSDPRVGDMWFDESNGVLKVYGSDDAWYEINAAEQIDLGTYTTDSLYSYWDMSSSTTWPGSGSTLYDLQGNQNLTNSGDAPSIQNSGTAAQYALQTSGDYPYWTASNRNYGVGTITIEAWVTTTGRVGDDYIFNFYSGGSGQQSRALRMDGSVTNGLSFVGNGSSGQDQNGLYSFSTNTWYQVVFAIDSYDNLSVYVNGSHIGDYTKDLSDGGSGGVTLGNTFWLDANNTTDFWRGGWALVRFYTKKLNATEVAANWNGTKSRFGY